MELKEIPIKKVEAALKDIMAERLVHEKMKELDHVLPGQQAQVKEFSTFQTMMRINEVYEWISKLNDDDKKEGLKFMTLLSELLEQNASLQENNKRLAKRLDDTIMSYLKAHTQVSLRY